MVRGVKRAEEPPRGAGVNELMVAGGKDNNYTNIRIRESEEGKEWKGKCSKRQKIYT
jgi:hypothetical protein